MNGLLQRDREMDSIYRIIIETSYKDREREIITRDYYLRKRERDHCKGKEMDQK